MKKIIFKGTADEVCKQITLSKLMCKMRGVKPVIVNAMEVEHGQA